MSFKAFLHRLNRKDKPIFRFHPLTQKFILIGLSLVLILGATKIFAQENYLKQKQDAMFNGSSQESWLAEALGSNLLSITNALGGPLPENVTNTNYNFDDFDISQKPGGAIGISTNLMASMYAHPPASGIQYLASIKDNILGKPAYAQGIGFQGLQPILPLWRGMRNIAYSIISLILIVIGVMVMLRVKISPQAVITIQGAIPKLITTLILITFSYAIAGLLIDLMYLIQAVGLALLFQIRGIGFNDNLIPGNNNFFQLNQAGFGRHMALLTKIIFSNTNWFPIGLSAIVAGIVTPISIAISGLTIFGATIGVTTLGGGILVGVIAILLFILIVLAFIFIQLLITILGLFKCYLSVILNIIFAPIIISMGAFPNSKTGFESWFKNLIANLTVFPIVYLFLVFINVLLYYIDKPTTIVTAATNSTISNLWAPNVISWGMQGIGNVGIRLAISITSFLILSKIPELIPQTVFGIKPSPWGQATSQSYASLSKSPFAGGALREGYKRYDKAASENQERRIRNRMGEMLNNGEAKNEFEARKKTEEELGINSNVFTKLAKIKGGIKQKPAEPDSLPEKKH